MKKPSMLVPVDDSVPEKVRADKAGDDNITVQKDPSKELRARAALLLARAALSTAPFH